MKAKTNVFAALLAMMSASTAYAYKIDGGPNRDSTSWISHQVLHYW